MNSHLINADDMDGAHNQMMADPGQGYHRSSSDTTANHHHQQQEGYTSRSILNNDPPPKAWDVFLVTPNTDEDETAESKSIEIILKFLKAITYVVTFAVVLGCAATSSQSYCSWPA